MAPSDKYERQFYPEVSFGGFTRCDGTVEFYTRINTLIGPGSVVVDFGCGRGEHCEDPVEFRRRLRCFRGRVARVIGLDADASAQRNPTIDEFRRLTPGQPWPLDDCSVHLVLGDCVIEHMPDPQSLFAEAKRVLVPGGYLCIRTTNLLSYVGLAAKLLPNRWHAPVLSRVQVNREAQDVFPTLYRCNTIRALKRQMEKHGFRARVYGHDAGPGYLAISKLTYAAGYLHQKIAPNRLRPTIMAFGQLLKTELASVP